MVYQFLDPRTPWYYPLRWAIIIFLGALAYQQSFGFGFTFDDYLFIVSNPFIKDFSQFERIWDHYPRTRSVGMYSFALNYALNQLHPFGYHLFNFLVHLTATGLVWGVASLLFKAESRLMGTRQPIYTWRVELPFIICLLFLLHPCQTQAITYITQRFESMATVFYLASIYFYLCARLSATNKGILFFILSAACAVFGVFTKEVTVTIPLTIITLEFILLSKQGSFKVFVAVGTFMLFLGYLLMKLLRVDLGIFLVTLPSDSHDGDILTPGNYFLTQMRVFLTFMRIMIFPVNQNLEYDFPMSTSLLHPPLTLVGAGLILLMILIICKYRKHFPLICFGFAWVLITFSINLAPRVNVIFEHKLYLISFGFLLSLTAGAALLIRNKKLILGIFILLMGVLSVLTFKRNQVWANELTLWEDVASKSPEKARVNAILGRVYGTYQRYDDAIKYLSKAILLEGDNFRTYVNRGFAYYHLKQFEPALADFNKSIAINPGYYEAYAKRSFIHEGQGRREEAYADLSRAIEIEPNYHDSFVQRGILYLKEKKLQEALSDFESALKGNPHDFNALNNLGYTHYLMGQYETALNYFNRAIKVDASKPWIYKNREECLKKLGRQK